jgi:hypothetical protein
MTRALSLLGQTFSRLTVMAHAPTPPRSTARWWRCQCACGQTLDVRSSALVSGNTKSCGCLKDETSGNHLITHGLSKLPEYRLWCHIIDRCENPRNKAFALYGAQGIRMIGLWRQTFVAFYGDMGHRPSPLHSIDRIDPAGPYTGPCAEYPQGNCRWATTIEQANNMRTNIRFTFNSRTQTLAEWCHELQLNYMTVYSRLERGWTIDRALTQRIRKMSRPSP